MNIASIAGGAHGLPNHGHGKNGGRATCQGDTAGVRCMLIGSKESCQLKSEMCKQTSFLTFSAFNFEGYSFDACAPISNFFYVHLALLC